MSNNPARFQNVPERNLSHQHTPRSPQALATRDCFLPGVSLLWAFVPVDSRYAAHGCFLTALFWAQACEGCSACIPSLSRG